MHEDFNGFYQMYSIDNTQTSTTRNAEVTAVLLIVVNALTYMALIYRRSHANVQARIFVTNRKKRRQ